MSILRASRIRLELNVTLQRKNGEDRRHRAR